MGIIRANHNIMPTKHVVGQVYKDGDDYFLLACITDAIESKFFFVHLTTGEVMGDTYNSLEALDIQNAWDAPVKATLTIED